MIYDFNVALLNTFKRICRSLPLSMRVLYLTSISHLWTSKQAHTSYREGVTVFWSI